MKYHYYCMCLFICTCKIHAKILGANKRSIISIHVHNTECINFPIVYSKQLIAHLSCY